MTIFKRPRQFLIKLNQIERTSKQLTPLISHYLVKKVYQANKRVKNVLLSKKNRKN